MSQKDEPFRFNPEDRAEWLDLLGSEAAVAQMERDLERENRKQAGIEKRQKAAAEKRAAKEADRLAKPPVDLSDAYWRHFNANPHPYGSAPWREWNQGWFEYEGKRWRRTATPMRSNSGKTVVAWNETFHAQDGETVAGKRTAPNRRNDPDRNWGCAQCA